jgi:hypothetical protein
MIISRKSYGLIVLMLALTSCVSFHTSSSDTGDTISDSTSGGTDVSISSDSSGGEPEPELEEADLSTFATDIVADPEITYVATDYTVKAYPNGYSYPLDAQVKPTNAYLEFWHPETELALRIVADKQVFEWIEQYGVNHGRSLFTRFTKWTLSGALSVGRR